jgi:small subunit ribosomal protein S20
LIITFSRSSGVKLTVDGIAACLTVLLLVAYNILFRRSWKNFLEGISYMANHFSALKRARQTERRSVRNRANTSRVRSAIRGLREALAAKDKKTAEAKFRETISQIDKAIRKGALHANTAARYKSRLSARLAQLG